MISAQQLVSLDPQVQQLLQALQAEHDAQLRAKDALIAQPEALSDRLKTNGDKRASPSKILLENFWHRATLGQGK
jgi:hypothetical protein